MSASLPEDVARFIADHIDSLDQLEILLLLAGRANDELTATVVASTLRLELGSVERRLRDLQGRALLATRTDSNPAYRYAPKSHELARTVERLAAAYGERRVAVITAIFSRPTDKVQSFADAFRVKKDK